MREVIHAPLVNHVGRGVLHRLKVIEHHLLAVLVGDLLGLLVLSQRVGRDDLIDAVLPAAVIYHKVAEAGRDHIVENVIAYLRVILRLRLHG